MPPPTEQKFAEAYARLTGLDPKVFGREGLQGHQARRRWCRPSRSRAQAKAFADLNKVIQKDVSGDIGKYWDGSFVGERAEEMKLTADLLLDNRAGKIALGRLLPLLIILLWQAAGGTNGSLFGGVLPTPRPGLAGLEGLGVRARRDGAQSV